MVWVCCVTALGCSSKKNNDAAGAAGTGGTTVVGTGGSTAPGTGGMPASLCPMPATPITSCGGVACPAVSAGLAAACVQICCTSANQCGTHNAALDTSNAQCMAPMQNSSLCPDETIMGNNVPGCCVPNTNTCGIQDLLTGMGCIPRNSMLLALIAPGLQPKNCDGTAPPMGAAGAGTGGMGTGGMGTGGMGTGGMGTGGMGTGGMGTGGMGTGGMGTGGMGTGGMGTGGMGTGGH